jgi:hypothetical protein
LKLAHFVEQHGMAQVQIRSSRVETGFDPQRSTQLQTRLQIGKLDDFLRATANQLERSSSIVHVYLYKPKFAQAFGENEPRIGDTKSAIGVNYSLTARSAQILVPPCVDGVGAAG